MKQILALLLLLIAAKAHGHFMLGQNIQQFDEGLGVPAIKVDGMRMYKWGSDRWLMAYFDSNGTVQSVCFYKKGIDFVPDEYSEMNQVMPEGSYTWEAKDTSKVPLQLPPELVKRSEFTGLWVSGDYTIMNAIIKAGESANSKFTSQSDLYCRGYTWRLTPEIPNKVADELNVPELKLVPTPKPNDYRWTKPLLQGIGGILVLVWIKLFWPETFWRRKKTNQFGIRKD
jgi:hypothetical protein